MYVSNMELDLNVMQTAGLTQWQMRGFLAAQKELKIELH